MAVNDHSPLNTRVMTNFKAVKGTYYILPITVFIVAFAIPLFLNNESSFIDRYIDVQKELFYTLNATLSSFPRLQLNLTQLGDVVLLFPLVSIFVLYAPKLWEVIIISTLISLVVSAGLKDIFSIPRPAAVFDNDSFVIIGRTLNSNSSLPSGHSISIFIIITLVFLAFIPKKNSYKCCWFLLMLSLGLLISFSRVGVGAHYPLDVISGSAIGALLAMISIPINNSMSWGTPLKHKKQTLLIIVLELLWMGLVIQRIITKNLVVTYLALVALIITLLLTLKKHVQKKN